MFIHRARRRTLLLYAGRRVNVSTQHLDQDGCLLEKLGETTTKLIGLAGFRFSAEAQGCARRVRALGDARRADGERVPVPSPALRLLWLSRTHLQPEMARVRVPLASGEAEVHVVEQWLNTSA